MNLSDALFSYQLLLPCCGCHLFAASNWLSLQCLAPSSTTTNGSTTTTPSVPVTQPTSPVTQPTTPVTQQPTPQPTTPPTTQPTNVSRPSVTPPLVDSVTGAIILREFAQCGGRGRDCKDIEGAECIDAAWAGFTCTSSVAPSVECVRRNAFFWQVGFCVDGMLCVSDSLSKSLQVDCSAESGLVHVRCPCARLPVTSPADPTLTVSVHMLLPSAPFHHVQLNDTAVHVPSHSPDLQQRQA